MGGVDDQKNYDALMKQIKAVIDADSAKIILAHYRDSRQGLVHARTLARCSRT